MGTEDLNHGRAAALAAKAYKPDLYKPEMCDRVIEMMSRGHTIRMCAVELGISFETFRQWVIHIEDFAEAYETGKHAAQAYFEKLSNDYMIRDVDSPLELDHKNHTFVMNTRFNVNSKTPEININIDGSTSSDRLQELVKQIRGENI